MTEVEIVHGNISKDVMFTAEGAWAYTTWTSVRDNLEDVVKNAVTVPIPVMSLMMPTLLRLPMAVTFGRDGARGKGNLRKGDSGR